VSLVQGSHAPNPIEIGVWRLWRSNFLGNGKSPTPMRTGETLLLWFAHRGCYEIQQHSILGLQLSTMALSATSKKIRSLTLATSSRPLARAGRTWALP
jgi:hypothetical protein